MSSCTPEKITPTTTPTQLQKAWEKEHLLHILTKESIARRDIAFLLVYYLGDLALFFEEKPSLYPLPSSIESDTKGIEEEPYIKKALSIGWVRNFPDGRFYPDDALQKKHLAIILQRVSKSLPLFPQKSLQRIEIKDVPSHDYLYPAVLFTVSYGFLKMQDHTFGKGRSVSGYDAARALSAFRKMLKK